MKHLKTKFKICFLALSKLMLIILLLLLIQGKIYRFCKLSFGKETVNCRLKCS